VNTVPFFVTAFLLIGVLAPGRGSAPDRGTAPDVRIERVRFNPPGADGPSDRSLNGEWVEVRNRSRRARSLRGWRLQGAAGQTYVFGDVRLAPGQSVRVHTGSGRDERGHVYWRRDAHAWRNSGSAVRLRSPSGRTDSCRWGPRGTVKRC